ncbi:MAG: response regulator [Terracidiphilus sp.]|jgi:DNA-binding response OmpR family regulator
MKKNEFNSLPISVRKQYTTFPTVPIKEVMMSSSTIETAYRPVVLVVDDESVIADSLTEILNRSGYAAVPAYDGEGALEVALLMPPELLISDVILPGMNGIELATTVRRIFPDCKVILFSGQASTVDLLASAKNRGQHFSLLTKPIHPTDLLARVKETFSSQLQHTAASLS